MRREEPNGSKIRQSRHISKHTATRPSGHLLTVK